MKVALSQSAVVLLLIFILGLLVSCGEKTTFNSIEKPPPIQEQPKNQAASAANSPGEVEKSEWSGAISAQEDDALSAAFKQVLNSNSPSPDAQAPLESNPPENSPIESDDLIPMLSPKITINAPQNQTIVQAPEVTIAGVVSDFPVRLASVSVKGRDEITKSITIDTDGTFSFPILMLGASTSITVSGETDAGTISDQISLKILPLISFTGPLDTALKNPTTTLTGTIQFCTITPLIISVNASPLKTPAGSYTCENETGTFSYTLDLPQTQNTIRVVASNGSGSSTGIIEISTDSPAIPEPIPEPEVDPIPEPEPEPIFDPNLEPATTNVVVKGSFKIWTNPPDPGIAENYKIIIEVTLPSDTTSYQRTDLTGMVQGSDGFQYSISNSSPIDLLDVLFKMFGAEAYETFYYFGNKAQLTIQIPGAAALVEDTITVHSTLLDEEQTVKIVF